MAREIVSVIENKKRNYIINGNFDFWQRSTSSTGGGYSTADRMSVFEDSGTITWSQSTDVPNGDSLYSFLATVTSAAGVGGFGTIIETKLEGSDIISLKDQTFTISFWVKSSIVGTYCAYIRNGSVNRSIVKEYTINAPNTWEKKSVTITHDSTGSWNYDNGIGFRIGFTLTSAAGLETTPDVWQAGSFIGTSNQVDFPNNAAATFQLSQIQLTKGEGIVPFETAGKTTEEEFALCQRYYETGAYRYRATIASGSSEWTYAYNTVKRAIPTVTSTSQSIIAQGTTSFRMASTTNAFSGTFTADAEL